MSESFEVPPCTCNKKLHRMSINSYKRMISHVWYLMNVLCVSQVCFFPRLQQFILTQEWNDPKSKLQQCCLTLRTLNGGEPDIPCYKVN